MFPGSNSPAENTRLSISTQFFTDYESALGYEFSSVAVYQYSTSLSMINLDPRFNVPQDKHVNKDALKNIDIFQEVQGINLGFACTKSQSVPGNESQVFLQCYIGNETSISRPTTTSMSRFYFQYSIDSRFDAYPLWSNTTG